MIPKFYELLAPLLELISKQSLKRARRKSNLPKNLN